MSPRHQQQQQPTQPTTMTMTTNAHHHQHQYPDDERGIETHLRLEIPGSMFLATGTRDASQTRLDA